ncbi:CDP-glycerol glycerophosphotransferase family protein [Actinoplanes sp. CA-051413]|uniref:bifunctional glycosyltransferase/CDP-glycerol:glycerophosphate glycerophosphotransferase n=1 Tax=Actinoplanes sp. CA-051413 TaxID=3239899 RepID=UPI003D964563
MSEPMSERVPGLVSVIVPIYNVEPFLRDCLDSLRAQTYADLQVLMVDDGSTDGSAAVAAEFAAADPRFELIRQANAGLSAARNVAVPAARGEYLAFVDSDDVLAAHAYELLVQALAGGADFASGAVRRYSSRGAYRGAPHNEAIATTDLNTHVTRRPELLRDRTIWNKLYRRSFYDAHGFEFPVGRLFEDVPVTVPAHALATSVAVVNEPIYFWRVREGAVRSITQSNNDLRNLVDRFFSVQLTRKLLTDAGQDELRRVYEEQAVWDKLSSYLRFLPAASPEFRETFMQLATDYLAELDPGAVDRQPAKVRKHWQLIRDRRLDDLVELIDRGFRKPRAASQRPLESAVRSLVWRDGRLELTGYAYVPGGPPRRFGSMRLLWLSSDGGRRRLPLRARAHRDPEARPAEQAAGFTVSIDPAVMRNGKVWRSGSWTVAVAAARGITVRRAGLRMPEGWSDPLPRKQLEPGVWVAPIETKGRLRLRISKSDGWLTASHRDGDDLVLRGMLRSRPAGPVRIELSRVRGIVTHRVPAEVSPVPDGFAFTARLPLAGIGLDVTDDNHAAGLYAQRFQIDIVVRDKPVQLVADDGYEPLRTVRGTDEVYTAVSAAGHVFLRTRPAGPVVTSAGWRPDGALVLSGDSPEDIEGELLLRLRGRRKDLSLPLRAVDGRWQAVVDPAAMPGLAGPLPLVAGMWDLSFRSAGVHHLTIASLGFTGAVTAGLPTSATTADGVRTVLRSAGEERTVLVVETPEPDPAEQDRLRAAYASPGARPALRDAVLFDAAPGRRFADDPAALLAELTRRPQAPAAHWTVERGQPVPSGAEPVTHGSEAWYAALTTSRWIVTNDDLPRWFRPADGQVVLRLAGGWPIARSGATAVAHPLGQELIDQLDSDAASWTALASPGPSATPVLRRELRFGGPVLEWGRPADDLLTTMDAETARAAVLARLALPADTRLILYAPTRRPMDWRKRGWSDPGKLLDLPAVVAALPPGHTLLVRRHPALGDDVLGLVPGVLDVSGYPQVGELLLAADALITDYSTLLADFAVTGRPALLHVPDLAEFQASPGLNVDLGTVAPGPLLSTSAEVAAALGALDTVAAEHAGAAKAFAETYATARDGRAAERLVDWLLAAGRKGSGSGGDVTEATIVLP